MDILYEYNGFVNSDLSCIKSFLDKAMGNLDTFIEDDDKLFDIKVILNELVVNGAMHGNQEEYNKKVFLDLSLNRTCIKIKVRDEGLGVKNNKTEYNCKDFKCSGRGLLIVEALTDELILNHNEVIAIKNI
ncbi:serine/threonine-protein kinase RsbW [Peptoniphilus olsenii]|uniref:Serine/threonine-protein kinase RsbW n=1 Tax=Peptoniphilus olsenii TaxID=411570 RepID=A0ABV2JCG8_9FIRM